MGTFTHSITLIGPTGAQETLEALVDTGATFSTVPACVLERLGVTPHRTVRLRLANGQIEERPISRVQAELDGTEEIILCIMGEPEAPPVIGAVTLETFLLAVDPVGQRLVPVEGFWLQRMQADSPTTPGDRPRGQGR